MKKSIIFVSIFFICVSVFAGEDLFIDSLRNCSTYRSSDTVSVNGIDAKSFKQISGWQGDSCTYKESIDFGGNSITMACRFSRPQIKEIADVADAYYLTLKYSNGQPDLSSLDSMKDNPVAQVFNKYLQDPSVCSISGQ